MLEVPGTVVVGLSSLATVRVQNRGGSGVTISSRLNLMEGDLRLIVTGPGGDTKKLTGAGGQPDTALRQVELPPGEQFVGVLNLLETSHGLTFPEPGTYALRAEYDPSPRMETLSSEPVTVTARPQKSKAEKGAGELLKDETVRRALVVVEPDAADKLQDLATQFAETPDGKLARLIIAGSGSAAAGASDSEDVFQADDPLATALNIAAVSTPFSRTGNRLAESFEAQVRSLDEGTPQNSGSAADIEDALRILRGQSFKI